MKKTLSVVLALCLLLSCCSFAVAENTDGAKHTYRIPLPLFSYNASFSRQSRSMFRRNFAIYAAVNSSAVIP